MKYISFFFIFILGFTTCLLGTYFLLNKSSVPNNTKKFNINLSSNKYLIPCNSSQVDSCILYYLIHGKIYKIEKKEITAVFYTQDEHGNLLGPFSIDSNISIKLDENALTTSIDTLKVGKEVRFLYTVINNKKNGSEEASISNFNISNN